MRVTARLEIGMRGKGECRLELPPPAISRLMLSDGGRVTIHFGLARGSAEIQPATRPREGSLRFAPALSGRFLAGHPLRLGRSPEGVRLGPLIGVMTSFAASRPRVTACLGPQDSSLRGLARTAAAQGAVVAVFWPGAFRPRRAALWGYVLSPSGARWRRLALPWPDIVYNRVSSRSRERRAGLQAVYRALDARYGPRFFNPGYLDKWNVYRWLRARPDTAAYLPDTVRFGSGGLRDMTARHPVLYLKQCGGSLGLGIVRIDRLGPSAFLVRHQRGPGKVRRIVARGLGGLRGTVRRMIKTRAYLVQQGIRLATFRGRAYDVRALAQKDDRGRWTVTGMAARVAGRGGIATHVPNGGTRQPLLTALRFSFASEELVARIAADLEQAALTLARGLDEERGNRFGELSLDLAVDYAGRIWVLELNAKPLRFDEDVIRQQAWVRLVQYSRYLLRFNPLPDEPDAADSGG
ncbi:MAG TPA: YheC/YheD family protein [Bacillota bacterium]|nr:YheC/YheD family protein [Bacillota bacterium]